MTRRTRRLVIDMTASMTPQGLNNCMLVPFPGSDLVNPRFFFSLLMVCPNDHHHGTQYIFSSYPTPTLHIQSSCSAPAFPCLIAAASYTFHPSILHIFCLLAQVSSVSFINFLFLFSFPLFFLSPLYTHWHTETHVTVPTAVELFSRIIVLTNLSSNIIF